MGNCSFLEHQYALHAPTGQKWLVVSFQSCMSELDSVPSNKTHCGAPER